MKTLAECISRISDKALRDALMEAYTELLESKVNDEIRGLYNYLVSTGDWVSDEGGKHEHHLRIATPPEYQEYLRNNFKQNEISGRAFSNAMIFSTTKNSNSRNLPNLIHEAARAYRMACVCEYALNGHDVASMEWPKKAQQFSDKFMGGPSIWTPPETAAPGNANPVAAEPEDRYKVTQDGQTYEEAWRKYADRNKKMRKH